MKRTIKNIKYKRKGIYTKKQGRNLKHSKQSLTKKNQRGGSAHFPGHIPVMGVSARIQDKFYEVIKQENLIQENLKEGLLDILNIIDSGEETVLDDPDDPDKPEILVKKWRGGKNKIFGNTHKLFILSFKIIPKVPATTPDNTYTDLSGGELQTYNLIISNNRYKTIIGRGGNSSVSKGLSGFLGKDIVTLHWNVSKKKIVINQILGDDSIREYDQEFKDIFKYFKEVGTNMRESQTFKIGKNYLSPFGSGNYGEVFHLKINMQEDNPEKEYILKKPSIPFIKFYKGTGDNYNYFLTQKMEIKFIRFLFKKMGPSDYVIVEEPYNAIYVYVYVKEENVIKGIHIGTGNTISSINIYPEGGSLGSVERQLEDSKIQLLRNPDSFRINCYQIIIDYLKSFKPEIDDFLKKPENQDADKLLQEFYNGVIFEEFKKERNLYNKIQTLKGEDKPGGKYLVDYVKLIEDYECIYAENTPKIYYTEEIIQGLNPSDMLKYPYITMNKCQGSMQNFIETLGAFHFSEKAMVYITRQLKLGLEFLHNNKIIHGDLAPRNILVCGDSTNEEIANFLTNRDKELNMFNDDDKFVFKITDYGFSKDCEESENCKYDKDKPLPINLISGNCLKSGLKINNTTDKYALGICVFEMLYKQQAYSGFNTLEELELKREKNEDYSKHKNIFSYTQGGSSIKQKPNQYFVDYRKIYGEEIFGKKVQGGEPDNKIYEALHLIVFNCLLTIINIDNYIKQETLIKERINFYRDYAKDISQVSVLTEENVPSHDSPQVVESTTGITITVVEITENS